MTGKSDELTYAGKTWTAKPMFSKKPRADKKKKDN